MIERLMKKERVTQFVYRSLIQAKVGNVVEQKFSKSQGKFKDFTNRQDEIVSLILRQRFVTQDVRLQVFIVRVQFNMIYTNNTLFRWKLVNSDKCPFCTNCVHDPTHLFATCRRIQTIWRNVQKMSDNLDLSIENIMCTESKLISQVYLITLVKRFLYVQFCLKEEPKLASLIAFLRKRKRLDGYNAKITGRIQQFLRQWKDIVIEI